MKLMPVGGVSLENVAQFMEAGAFAVGIGSYLANPSLANEGRWKEIARRAKAFRGQVDAR
jgi:2-dehydro-3-deoxyphosphogluconate aldolase/(4S)-4-hydroxy-2-oxoglutarate aldolase